MRTTPASSFQHGNDDLIATHIASDIVHFDANLRFETYIAAFGPEQSPAHRVTDLLGFDPTTRPIHPDVVPRRNILSFASQWAAASPVKRSSQIISPFLSPRRLQKSITNQ